MPESEKKAPDEISKTTIKRDMVALQKIGEVLVKMPLVQLEKIPLPEELREAIHTARTLKSHEALRRQLQYVGKLMRYADIEAIQLAIKHVRLSNAR